MSLAVPPWLAPLLAQPVALFGAGVSGEALRALCAVLGTDAVVYDENSARGAMFDEAAATRHRLAVFSPGFPARHPWIERARAAGLTCLGELDLASVFWSGRLIAVTGTNGKTTLTEFLAHALRSVGRDARATGNIGDPFSRLVVITAGGSKDEHAICEVSSFQAETLQHLRADATLWTNFAEDHLERHAGLENYFSAKWKLVEHTDPGAVFVGSSVQRFAQKFERPLATVVTVATEEQPEDSALRGTVFATYPQRENFVLAAAWWRSAGLDPAALVAAARTFELGPHRLKPVAEQEGVRYWNDSKATNFHAVEAALAGFAAPVILIAGGKSKGGDLGGFVHRIAPRVKHVLLIGETSADLAFHCSTFRIAHTRCTGLEDAVRRAAEFATAGDHVLLSPGFASFDLFRNYAERGEQFEKLVLALGPPGRVSPASLR